MEGRTAFLLSLALLCVGTTAQVSVAPLQAVQNTAPGIYNAAQNPNPNVTSTWQTLGAHPIVGIHVGHVPGTDAYLYLGRNSAKPLASAALDWMVGVYDLATNSFKNVSTDTNIFCTGPVVTHDGHVLSVGGHSKSPSGVPDGRKSIQVYNYQQNSTHIHEVTKMRFNRWYPSATLRPDNTVLIMGGTIQANEFGNTSKFFEVWDPKKPNLFPGPMYPLDPDYINKMGKNFYPSNFVLPTGEVFNLIDQTSRIIKPDNTYRLGPDGKPLQAPPYPAEWKTQFPHSGSPVMTALTYTRNYSTADIVMFGGAPASSNCTANYSSSRYTPANPYSFRIRISFQQINGDWNYTFGNWIKELMGIPRVGGDAVLLPNGDAVLLGGAQTGCTGGISPAGISRGDYPAFWTLLYQPDKPKGSRYTVMSATSIARVYHGTSLLTTDGTILVQGSDAVDPKTLITNATFWSRCPTGRREFRNELFSPPYALDTLAKPKILSVQGNTDSNYVVPLKYGQLVNITWAPLIANQTQVKVTQVSLVAPSATTHGFNSNQRVVFLRITRQDPVNRILTVRIPDSTGVLPPQFYKLFILNVKTYSRARWIRL